MNAIDVKPLRTGLTLDGEEYEMVQESMRPNAWSMVGFLGTDESLRQVTIEDNETLEKLGITHAQISDRLNAIVKRGYEAKDEEAIISGKFLIKGFYTRGWQNCPFTETTKNLCGRGSSDYTIENIETGKKIKFPSLIIHLIKEHHFFEGRGTSYRLDPQLACEVLEIKPGVDYELKTVKKVSFVWAWCSTDNWYPAEREEMVSKIALQTYKINACITAYLLDTPIDLVKEETDYLHVFVKTGYKMDKKEKYKVFDIKLTIDQHTKYGIYRKAEKTKEIILDDENETAKA